MCSIAVFLLTVWLLVSSDCAIFSDVDELDRLVVQERLLIPELKTLSEKNKNDYVIK